MRNNHIQSTTYDEKPHAKLFEERKWKDSLEFALAKPSLKVYKNPKSN